MFAIKKECKSDALAIAAARAASGEPIQSGTSFGSGIIVAEG